jgi:hypothetical protein
MSFSAIANVFAMFIGCLPVMLAITLGDITLIGEVYSGCSSSARLWFFHLALASYVRYKEGNSIGPFNHLCVYTCSLLLSKMTTFD